MDMNKILLPILYLSAHFAWLAHANSIDESGREAAAAFRQDKHSSIHVSAWPPITAESRPWTRWWWHGAAVDKKNLMRLLEVYHEAGLGGVEITSIYGVKGQEHRNIDYLSPQWLEMVRHVISEAERLGMGVDLPPGCGWRIGGDYLPESLGAAVLKLEPSLHGTGYSARCAPLDERVKRAGPGGTGRAFNPFYRPSLQAAIDHFSPHFQSLGIRAQFHDSWEYNSTCSPDFFTAFAKHCGYDLRDYLPELAADGDPDTAARVRYDVQTTLADLALHQFIHPWAQWCGQLGQLSRNQGHGSPGNPLDFYAAVDIPETETFGTGGGDMGLLFKLASSAAHVEGKRLVAAETAVWMREHFHGSLADIKQLADRYFTAGINHLIYHGTAYSPADAPWPGWLFYASTQLNPQNTIWHDLPTLNTYITRCQSVLQCDAPANDLLVYLPIHDVFQDADLELAPKIGMDGKWFRRLDARATIEQLWRRGYAFDYISDDQLLKSRRADKGIEVNGGTYKAILIPPCRILPLATLQKLVQLSQGADTVVFADKLPQEVPGLMDLQQRRQVFQSLIGRFEGQVDLDRALQKAGVKREALVDEGDLLCLRRRHDSGCIYFVTNQSAKTIDRDIPLAFPGRAVLIMDPMSGETGLARLCSRAGIRLQLEPGASLILKTFTHDVPQTTDWFYRDEASQPMELKGRWQVTFISGGPVTPAAYDTHDLASWADHSPDAERFAGTARYRLRFDAPQPSRSNWLLDLGEVCHSARVTMNGQALGTLIGPSYRMRIGPLKPRDNILDVEVTNLAANRIRDLDRRQIAWRIFEDINFVNRRYRAFDASAWDVMPSGLLGPVTLIPLR